MSSTDNSDLDRTRTEQVSDIEDDVSLASLSKDTSEVSASPKTMEDESTPILHENKGKMQSPDPVYPSGEDQSVASSFTEETGSRKRKQSTSDDHPVKRQKAEGSTQEDSLAGVDANVNDLVKENLDSIRNHPWRDIPRLVNDLLSEDSSEATNAFNNDVWLGLLVTTGALEGDVELGEWEGPEPDGSWDDSFTWDDW